MIYQTFRNRLRKASSEESGSAIVEMAISSVVMIATFIGIFQLTMACYTYNTVAELTRESARWAMVRGGTCSTNTPNLDHCGATSSDIQDHAKAVSAALDWSQCTSTSPCVSTTWKTGATTAGVQQASTTWTACDPTTSTVCKIPGSLVIVNMTYPYSFAVPFLGKYNMNMASQAEMVISQ
jgi:Flp pilus assembly protein TadG